MKPPKFINVLKAYQITHVRVSGEKKLHTVADFFQHVVVSNAMCRIATNNFSTFIFIVHQAPQVIICEGLIL